jgi:hypothetical protein
LPGGTEEPPLPQVSIVGLLVEIWTQDLWIHSRSANHFALTFGKIYLEKSHFVLK